jgi:DNA-binding transcriptional LysR family regulator
MSQPGLSTAAIEELRTFCTAAELGSLGRAALSLHVSQPALSKRLAHLEVAAGTQLMERSPRGVKLTPSGHRLYEEARRLLKQAERVQEVITGLQRSDGPVRLASSHSAAEALVGDLLGQLNERRALPVELVIANSSVVRDLVADGRADLGVAASRPNGTPYPAVREAVLAEDAVVCAVPITHLWARRRSISLEEFLRTPMVTRDPSSNARWTVAAVLREHELTAARPLIEAGTPQAAIREARARNAPLLLSGQVLVGHDFHELEIEGLSFPRQFVFVLPACGEPLGNVLVLMEKLRHQATILCGARRPTPAAAASP